MIQGYCPPTTKSRVLPHLAKYPWRWLLSPAGHQTEATSRSRPCAIDNGAYSCFEHGKPFMERTFVNLVKKYGKEADWVVVPDSVGNKDRTLKLARRWIPCMSEYRLLLAVQDGMEEKDVLPFADCIYGIFLGGSTPWKFWSMGYWGTVAIRNGWYYHIGRVNSIRRIRRCIASGADSFDGSGMSRFPRNARTVSDFMASLSDDYS